MFKVYDKHFKRIKRGQWVKYNDQNYKVSFVVPGKLILNDGEKHITLTSRSKFSRDRFYNIEVVFDKEEARRMQGVA